MKTTIPPKSKLPRLLRSMFGQRSKTPWCPEDTNLEGQIVAITGGNSGIGYETARGLAARGAEVIILSRNKEKSLAAIAKMKQEVDSHIHFVQLDLSDLFTIPLAVEKVREILNGRKLSKLIANAGIIPNEHSKSPQGYEMAFMVNVFGNHVLVHECLQQGILPSGSQVIVIAGDIYIMAKDCTSDFSYTGSSGSSAYSRSKLGCMWWAIELDKRNPKLKVNIVHPGVVDSGLGGETTGMIRKLMRKWLLISPELGAQTTLLCATQPNIASGEYYHNTMGKVELRDQDIALDQSRSGEFWDMLEQLRTKHRKESSQT